MPFALLRRLCPTASGTPTTPSVCLIVASAIWLGAVAPCAAQAPVSRLDRVFHGFGYRPVEATAGRGEPGGEARSLPGPALAWLDGPERGQDESYGGGGALVGTAWAGLWLRSGDVGGWRVVSDGVFTSPAVTALARAPSDPAVVYAGTGHLNLPDGLVPGSGVYRSGDGGRSWVSAGLDSIPWVIDLAVDPDRSGRVYAAAIGMGGDRGGHGGLYRLGEDGLWEPVFVPGARSAVTAVDLGGGRPAELYVAVPGSHEGAPEPGSSGGAREGGVWRSDDDGRTWTTLSGDLPTAEARHIELAVSRSRPSVIYVLVVSSAGGGLYRSGDSGATWEQMRDLEGILAPLRAPGAVPRLEILSGDPDSLALRAPTGVYRSGDGGRTWAAPGDTVHAPPRAVEGVQARLVRSPHDSTVYYRIAEELERSLDGGERWEAIGPTSMRNQPGAGMEAGAVRLTVAEESPLEPGLLWVGTDRGIVHLSRDAGSTWKASSLHNGEPGPPGRVIHLEPSPHDPGRAYVVVDRTSRGDLAPLAYRTDDYGERWTVLTGSGSGFAAADPLTVVREDPESPGLLLAGSALGIYVSFDDGASWDPLQLDLPRSPVDSLIFVGRDLHVVTRARGRYVMDELTPLREVIRGLATGEPYLFEPAPVHPGAELARRGVILDYLLPSFVRNVALEVIDGAGEVVAVFQSIGGRDVRSRGERGTVNGEPADPSIPGTRAGVHRVRWHPVPNARAGGASDQVGPLRPGVYRLRLLVDGLVRERSFEVFGER